METLLPLATAAVLGFVHALEVDHMVAVTTFVARRPALASALSFGFRWGVGHSLAVLVVGAVLLATGVRFSARHERLGEALVGVTLIAVGAWGLRSARNLHLHAAPEHGDHAHLHAHGIPGPAHGHGHHHATGGAHGHGRPDATEGGRRIGLVGMVHGLAGTSAIVALVPVTLAHPLAVGIGYLVTFGVGVTVAMSLFAAITSLAMRQAADRSLALGRRVSAAVSSGGIALGAWWLVRALRA